MSDNDEKEINLGAQEGKKTSKNNKVRKYKIGFALSATVLLIAVFLPSSNFVTKPFVESQLKHIAANIATQASLSGDEALFTYGEVSIDGGFFNNKITVEKPRLQYVAHLPFGNVQKTDVTTSRAEVSSDKISANAIVVSFPDSFEVSRDGYASITTAFSKVPEYEFSKVNDVELHLLHLPPAFTMTTHAAGSDPVKVSVSYAPEPLLKRVIDHAANTSDSELKFENVKITSSEEEGTLQFEDLHGKSSESPSGKDARQFTGNFKVNQFELVKNESAKGPYDFAMDMQGVYLMPLKTYNGYTQVRDMEIVVDKVSLKHKDYEVNISGVLSLKPEDNMPFGLLNIGIKGLDKFRNSEFVPVADTSLKDAVIGAITGNDDVQMKDSFFTFKREKNGTIYIGDTSFENLVGLILTHSLSNKNIGDEVADEEKEPVVIKQGVEVPKPSVSGQAAPLPVIKKPVAKPAENPAENTPSDSTNGQ